jgi:kexin
MMVTRKISEINNFEKLEHITVKVWITHAKRGDVEVELVSPGGVKSILAGARKHDDDSSGFNGWQFMTLKHWDEEHLGEWSIRVSDQHDAAKNGSFLGWSMMFWGSAKEPGQAKLYELPEESASISTSSLAPTSTDSVDSTKTYIKPTQFLSTGHGDVHGETTSAAFQKPTDAINAAVSPTPDEGYFMPSLLKSQTWLFVALGAVFLFGIGAAVFFWRRSVQRRVARGDYMTVAAGDDLPMSSLDHQGRGGLLRGDAPRTKELYDAFGELSDDEDADEAAALTRGHDGDDVPYHDAHDSSYRDDDEVDPSSSTPYRGDSARVGGRDTPGSGSGGESWEHASDAARQ